MNSRRVAHRLPRPGDFTGLLRVNRPQLDRRRRRLATAQTIDDLRSVARRAVPRSVFDYVDGGAEDEISMARARAAFERVAFHPRVLRDVSTVDLSTTVLGGPAALPLVLAPTGFTRMMHHEGEVAVARAAARAGVPYALSTMGTTSPEDLRSAVPGARHWFQLYLWQDRSASRDLVQRAAECGYESLVLTVDTPIGGARLRDVRNGLTVPPALTARTLADMAVHPRWWLNLLTTEPLSFAAMSNYDGTVAELVARMFRPAATLTDLDGCGSTGRTVSSSRASRMSGTRSRSPTVVSMLWSSPTTAAGSWTALLRRWSCCRTSSTRSVTAARSSSTRACAPAPTWRRLEPSVPPPR